MFKGILNTADAFKKLPHNVEKIVMKPSGSKYSIYVHCADMPPVQIGRYDTKEQAHSAMEQLSVLTNRKITK